MSPTKIAAQQNTLVMRVQTACFASIFDAALSRARDDKIVLVMLRAG
jgi:hypothetical protein